MAALTLTMDTYRDKILGGWTGKSIGVTLGSTQRGQLVPGRSNYYSPVPGQPVASLAMDFPLVWLATLEQAGPDLLPEDLAVAWLEHLDYSQDEFGYAALNLRRGLPPPASGAHSNWFRNSTGGVMRADLWAMVAPGNPQIAAAYAYQDAKLDHCEDGIWAAMFLAALASASFFLADPLTLLTIGLAMIPRTCRTARSIKAALAAVQRGAAWLEARESVQHEVGHKNYTDVAQNMGFFTVGLFYGMQDFGSSLCAATNCGYDAEVVGGALGAVLGIQRGRSGLPDAWTGPIGDVVIPGNGLRDFTAPLTLTEVAERTLAVGRRIVEERCPEIGLEETFSEPALPTSAPPPLETQPMPEPASSGTPAPESAAPAEYPDEPTVRSLIPDFTETAPPPTVSETDSASAPGIVPEQTPLPPLPTAESSGAMPGFTPQPISREEPTPLTLEPQAVAQPAVGGAAPLAPDPVSAIAWADSTLVKPLLVTAANTFFAHAGEMEVIMNAGDSPTLAYNIPRTLSFTLINRGADPFSGRISLLAPSGWQIAGPDNLGQRQYLAAHTGTLRIDFTLRVAEGQGRIDIANALTLRLTPDAVVASPLEAEFLLLGASCWYTVGTFANFDGEGFDRSYGPEDRPGLHESYVSRTSNTSRWERNSYPESALDLEPLFRGSSGVCYGQTVLRSPTTREARLVANTNSGVKVWINGMLILRRMHRETFRPVLGSGPWAVDITLRAGDNPLMVKWVRGSEPYEFSLTVSDRQGRGLPEVGNTSW